MKIETYYQIDFIDKNGLANYIDTFQENEFEEAKKHYKMLSNALACIDKDTKYVLDLYAHIPSKDNSDKFIMQILPEIKI